MNKMFDNEYQEGNIYIFVYNMYIIILMKNRYKTFKIIKLKNNIYIIWK